jgi:hypothetical protein
MPRPRYRSQADDAFKCEGVTLMANLNILVTAPFRRQSGRRINVVCAALVRHGTSLVESEDQLWSITIPQREIYDAECLNGAGNLGAFVSYWAQTDIDAAIAKLRTIWGDIPAQMNLGANRIR